MILVFIAIICSVLVGCTDNENVNSSIATSKEYFFNEITNNINILNDRYFTSDDGITRGDDEDDDTELKEWAIAWKDFLGAATGAGLGIFTLNPAGFASLTITGAVLASLSEYEEQVEKRKDKDDAIIEDIYKFYVDTSYPIRDVNLLDEISEFSYVESGYYHNEIIKFMIINNPELCTADIEPVNLLEEIIYVAENQFKLEFLDEEKQYMYENINYFVYPGLETLIYDYDLQYEVDILLSYFEKVSSLDNYDVAYAYTIDFLSILDQVLYESPDYSTSIAMINSSISVAIYSRTLWNLYEFDPCLSNSYPVFNIAEGEWSEL